MVLFMMFRTICLLNYYTKIILIFLKKNRIKQ